MKTIQSEDLQKVSAGVNGTIDSAEHAQLKADWVRYQESGSQRDLNTYFRHFREALRD